VVEVAAVAEVGAAPVAKRFGDVVPAAPSLGYAAGLSGPAARAYGSCLVRVGGTPCGVSGICDVRVGGVSCGGLSIYDVFVGGVPCGASGIYDVFVGDVPCGGFALVATI
tara:strand:- start:57 stop:386 length:330 start_codon:yes stop_codon:yes gene_type:complete